MTGYRHLLYVLALTEAGLAVLAALGATLAMGGNPLYLLSGLAVAAVYVVAGLNGRRRWALITLIAIESLRLVAFGLSAVLGALPWVQLTLTVSTLTDSVLLPAAMIVVAGRLLAVVDRPPLPATLVLTGGGTGEVEA
jgi:hypothetical protein